MKEVRPQDLMIGNYVRIANVDTNLESYIGRIGKVVMLEDDRIVILLSKKKLDNIYCSDLVGELEAIPIDWDMMTRLGWKKSHEVVDTLVYEQSEPERRLTLYTNNTLLVVSSMQTIFCKVVESVHELQNALKICDVKDMISYD